MCVCVCVSFHRDFHRRYGRLFFFSVGHAIFLRTVGFTVRNAVRTAFIHNTTGDPIAFEEGYMVFDRYGVCACVCACVCVSVCVCVCVLNCVDVVGISQGRVWVVVCVFFDVVVVRAYGVKTTHLVLATTQSTPPPPFLPVNPPS